ncbi:hypothetical protein BD309DRAFT_975958 [Dichomitus squalens]|nr:hypothetical protein BD309DRAFT_975958 [Dichomitus squalens]
MMRAAVSVSGALPLPFPLAVSNSLRALQMYSHLSSLAMSIASSKELKGKRERRRGINPTRNSTGQSGGRHDGARPTKLVFTQIATD